jgi:hypothetical protein
MCKSHQAIFSNQANCGVFAPHSVSPTFGQKRVNTTLNPSIQPVEKQPDMCLAIEAPPTTYYGIDPANQFLKRYGSLPSREVSDLILETLHRLLSGYGIQVVGIGLCSTFLRREFVASTLLYLITQELKAMADVNNSGFLNIQLDSQLIPEKSLGKCKRLLGLLLRSTNHHEIVRPPGESKACFSHCPVKWIQKDI